jgi:hypothetical protein
MKKGIDLKVLAIFIALVIVVSGVAPGIAVTNQSNDASNQLYELNESKSFPILSDADINDIANKFIPECTEKTVNGSIRLLSQNIGLDEVALNSNGSYELINGYRAQVLDSDTSSSHSIHALDVNVTFGKLTVHSKGHDGKPLVSYVYVYNQLTGSQVASDSTSPDGLVSFYLASDTYKIRVNKPSFIDYYPSIYLENVTVASGLETNKTVTFDIPRERHCSIWIGNK